MNHRTIIFAKNLMTLRTLNGMTQQELADKIHVTRQTTELVDLILKYYEELSEKYRKMIPLKKVFIPVAKDDKE